MNIDDALLVDARKTALQVAQRQQMDTRCSTTLTEVAEELERWLLRGLDEPLPEVMCPSCGATIRARMADAPADDEPPPVDASYAARLAGALAWLVDTAESVRATGAELPDDLRRGFEHARRLLEED